MTEPYWVSKNVYEGSKGPPTKKFSGEKLTCEDCLWFSESASKCVWGILIPPYYPICSRFEFKGGYKIEQKVDDSKKYGHGSARCEKCRITWDLDTLRERPDYKPGFCPVCGGPLKRIKAGEGVRTPEESMMHLEWEWYEFGLSLDAMPVGTTFTIQNAPGAKSFEGTWERVNLAGDPLWHNLDTDDYKVSRDFRIVRGQVEVALFGIKQIGTTYDKLYKLVFYLYSEGQSKERIIEQIKENFPGVSSRTLSRLSVEVDKWSQPGSEGEMKKCPKCGGTMTIGVSHADYGTMQYECRSCGYCEVVTEGRRADTFTSVRNFALSYYLQGMIKDAILDEIKATLPYLGDDVLRRLSAEIDRWELFGPPEEQLKGGVEMKSVRREVIGQEEVVEKEPPSGKVENYKCQECGKPMTPAEWMLGHICGECVKKHHREVVGPEQEEVVVEQASVENLTHRRMTIGQQETAQFQCKDCKWYETTSTPALPGPERYGKNCKDLGANPDDPACEDFEPKAVSKESQEEVPEEQAEEKKEEVEKKLEEVVEDLEKAQEEVEEAGEKAETPEETKKVEEVEQAAEEAAAAVEEASEAVEGAETPAEVEKATETLEEAEKAVEKIPSADQILSAQFDPLDYLHLDLPEKKIPQLDGEIEVGDVFQDLKEGDTFRIISIEGDKVQVEYEKLGFIEYTRSDILEGVRDGTLKRQGWRISTEVVGVTEELAEVEQEIAARRLAQGEEEANWTNVVEEMFQMYSKQPLVKGLDIIQTLKERIPPEDWERFVVWFREKYKMEFFQSPSTSAAQEEPKEPEIDIQEINNMSDQDLLREIERLKAAPSWPGRKERLDILLEEEKFRGLSVIGKLETPFEAVKRTASMLTEDKSEAAAQLLAKEFRSKKARGKGSRPLKSSRPKKVRRSDIPDKRLPE